MFGAVVVAGFQTLHGIRASASSSSTSVYSRCRSSGSASSSQVRGAATVGWSRPRSEYGAMVVLEPLFCDQSMKTFLARNTFAIRETTRSGMSCSIASAISLANSDASSEVSEPSSRL